MGKCKVEDFMCELLHSCAFHTIHCALEDARASPQPSDLMDRSFWIKTALKYCEMFDYSESNDITNPSYSLERKMFGIYFLFNNRLLRITDDSYVFSAIQNNFGFHCI